MDAMASRRALGQFSGLWQLPLLVVSLGLFGYAAYRFIDPKPAITIAQRLETAQFYIKHKQFDLAIAQSNKLIATANLKPEQDRVLRISRDQLRNGHPLDPQAAYLIGKIRQEQNDPRQAISFYETVMVDYPESPPVPLARLGRAQCRIAIGQDDAALTDIHDLVAELGARKSREIFRAEAISGLKHASAALAAKDNLKAALEVIGNEQVLDTDPPPDFFARLGGLLQRRADQVEASVASAPTVAEKDKRHQQAVILRIQAGDSQMALARGLTMSDDRGQADAILKAVDLYDAAGASDRAISALEKYATERPGDGQTPAAPLRLGRFYQVMGRFDKAIAAFQKIQFRYPQSLAASRSGVLLAQCLIAKGLSLIHIS